MPHFLMQDPEGMAVGNEILRLINNQRREHTPHAFKGVISGLADFSKMWPLLGELSCQDLNGYLDVIDEMAATHSDCNRCSGKIAAYCQFVTDKRLPERHLQYAATCDKLQARERDESRNYRREVMEGLVNAGCLSKDGASSP